MEADIAAHRVSEHEEGRVILDDWAILQDGVKVGGVFVEALGVAFMGVWEIAGRCALPSPINDKNGVVLGESFAGGFEIFFAIFAKTRQDGDDGFGVFILRRGIAVADFMGVAIQFFPLPV